MAWSRMVMKSPVSFTFIRVPWTSPRPATAASWVEESADRVFPAITVTRLASFPERV